MSLPAVKLDPPDCTRSMASDTPLSAGAQLFEHFQKLFVEHLSLHAVDQSAGNSQKLRILCFQVCETPAFIESFKGNFDDFSTITHRALLCGWLAYLIADKLKLSVTSTKELFLAGLISNNAETDESSNRAYDQYEQHLSTEAQIQVVATDIVEALLNSASQTGHLSFVTALPVLKLNAALYYRDVYNAGVDLISVSNADLVASMAEHSAVVNKAELASIIDSHARLSLRWPAMLSAQAELAILPDALVPRELISIAKRAWLMVTTAGILSDDLIKWISLFSQRDESSELDELDRESAQVLLEAEVLLNELDSMIVRFGDLLGIMLKGNVAAVDVTIYDRLVELNAALVDPEEQGKSEYQVDLNDYSDPEGSGDSEGLDDSDEFSLLAMCRK